MADKRRGKADKHKSAGRPARRSSTSVSIRKAPDGSGWELVPPRCASDRADDLEEVQKMIDAGETEVAQDELRWLLSGCSDFIDAHRLLGELALLENDVALARGHFGYAYQLGLKAMQQAPEGARLPYALPGNKAFFEAAKGLVWSLKQLGKDAMAQEAAERLLELDPGDPLDIAALVRQSGEP